MTFAIGLLILVGTILYALYTAPGLALLPVSLIKSAPSISSPALAADTSSQLDQNRERQRQLEGRSEGRPDGLDPRDRRELEALVREERTLVRRERLAAENTGEGRNFFIRIWVKLEAVFRPLKLVVGMLLLVISLIIFASMLITMVDKIKNSVCGVSCGYLLGRNKIFQPINALLMQTSKIFPIDYVIFLLLTLLFFAASVVGLASIGIRFLWVMLFRIRKGQTSPNAMLMATVLLTLMTLAMNYALAMVVAPSYSTFGPQMYCDLPLANGTTGDCSQHKSAIKPCSERSGSDAAKLVCTPTVLSTFLNRIMANFPYFGVVIFYTQFAFLGIFLIVFIVTLFRVPTLDEDAIDDDLREEEEEGLLESTGRRFGATWEDITGRARGKGVQRAGYGTVDGGDN